MITNRDIKKMKRLFATKEDEVIKKLNEHDETINNHGHRIERIEDKVFA